MGRCFIEDIPDDKVHLKAAPFGTQGRDGALASSRVSAAKLKIHGIFQALPPVIDARAAVGEGKPWVNGVHLGLRRRAFREGAGELLHREDEIGLLKVSEQVGEIASSRREPRRAQVILGLAHGELACVQPHEPSRKGGGNARARKIVAFHHVTCHNPLRI